MQRTLTYSIIGILAVLGYSLAVTPDWQEAIGAAAGAIAKPIVVPLVELINIPAFVYTMALTILIAGIVACVAYWFRAVRPRLRQLRSVRAAILELPLPSDNVEWLDAMQKLGDMLRGRATFVSAWSEYQAKAYRSRGIPETPFSHFVASEPQYAREKAGLMASLPGYFTSLGLILTFIGLVVALYFAAKGFRSGNIQEARAAIVQLLNAASFKFLTSVSALISALLISLFMRFCLTIIMQESLLVTELVESYLSAWREHVGVGQSDGQRWSADMSQRIEALLVGMQNLTRAVERLAQKTGERLEADDAAR